MHLETWSRSAKSLGLMAFRCNTAIRRCSNRASTSYLTPPVRTNDDGTVIPALQGVRLHDLRRTFATLQLSPGVHFMQACKWLGHRTFTLTRTPKRIRFPRPVAGLRISCPRQPRERNR